MAKRNKRIRKGIESLKEEIEKHFEKLDREILENDGITAKYHIKEIDLSLIMNLGKKIALLGKDNIDKESKELIANFRKKLEEYKKKISME